MRLYSLQHTLQPRQYYPLNLDYVEFIKEIQREKQKPSSAKERRARKRRIKKMVQSEMNRTGSEAWMDGV